MIIHLTGSDTYRSHQRLKQLRQAFRDKFDPSGFNTVTVDGLTASTEELRTAIQTTGFFSKQRFVAIDQYSPAKAACDPTTLGHILEPIAKPADIIVVIRQIDSEPVKKKKKTAARKSVKSVSAPADFHLTNAKREEFLAQTSAQAAAWVIAETKTRGGLIVRPAAEELVMLCANDSWRISNELDKLMAYTNNQAITIADVRAFVSSPYASDIFGLTDAIGQRRTAAALSLLHRELQSGTHPLALISTLANHLRVLLSVRRAMGTSAPSRLAADLGLHPYLVQKALQQTKLFAPEMLRRWHHQLVAIDFQLKTTRLDAETLLDVMLVQG